ncbi:SIR2 family protein [Staphylococcus aureus]|nr:SIR2 family protein [Staphylococcus aureus]UXT30535.1 SIR2 family protein [Staphylococcus aureus]UXU15490.1 SIR2 family protein [Staphylococcus aureus]
MIDYQKFLDEIHGKNINFLIGSGASVGIIASLWMEKLDLSFEELLTNDALDNNERNILYLVWFEQWIQETRILEKDVKIFNQEQKDVVKNYEIFISYIVKILNNEGYDKPKRVNIFTTNYDTLFELAFDRISKKGSLTYFNDGSKGFLEKTVSSENYFINASHSGISDNFNRNIPVINLLKMHGSITWKKQKESISISNTFEEFDNLNKELNKFNNLINNESKSISNYIFDNEIITIDSLKDRIKKLLTKVNEENLDLEKFINMYKKLPVVNPTKGKFKETVFQQHYYQLMRLLSFELERKDTVLIVFGFSFSDEHILEIVRRSIINPYLKVYVICYDSKSKIEINEKLNGLSNITYWPQNFDDDRGDFEFLNNLLKGWQ